MTEPPDGPHTRAAISAEDAAAADPARARSRRPGQVLECGWCGGPIAVAARGRVPKWCSSSCRHRAWEQTRAAESGRAAVRVVDRVVETQPRPSPDTSSAEWPKGPGWATALDQLTHQLDTGRVYDRDLAVISTATVALNEALSRRVNARGRRR